MRLALLAFHTTVWPHSVVAAMNRPSGLNTAQRHPTEQGGCDPWSMSLRPPARSMISIGLAGSKYPTRRESRENAIPYAVPTGRVPTMRRCLVFHIWVVVGVCHVT